MIHLENNSKEIGHANMDIFLNNQLPNAEHSFRDLLFSLFPNTYFLFFAQDTFSPPLYIICIPQIYVHIPKGL